MELPFTAQQFFEVFRSYNEGVWPAQVALGLVALFVVVALAYRPQRFSKPIAAIVAMFWLWMGIAYHFAFFAAINPAARIFGALFVLQGLLVLYLALSGRLEFARGHGLREVVGWLLIAYALVGYPLIGYLAGQSYPEMPTFGLPCPTTIFTFGVLFFLRAPFPRLVLVIPILWAAIGSSAAISLAVPEDYGLLVAGLCGLGLALILQRETRRGIVPA